MAASDEEFERIQSALVEADRALVRALDARAAAVQKWIELRERQPDRYLGWPRDQDVIERAEAQAQVFPRASVQPVFREVLSASAVMIAPIEVVYMGLEGGLGHTAARLHFGAAVTMRSAETAEAVIVEVERGRASVGLIPWETSNDGAVTQTLNLLARSDVKISAEVPVPSSYHLLSQATDLGDIQRIYGTPSALAAVEAYVRSHCPKAQVIDTATGMVAAARAKDDPSAAAVTTEVVARSDELPVLRRAIEDRRDRQVRYAAVSRDFPARTGRDRTSVVLALHDAPGILYACLQPLADRNLNLSRLETRPATDLPWRYLILMEVDGHITDRPVLAAIEEIRAANRHVKVLGSYPRPESRD